MAPPAAPRRERGVIEEDHIVSVNAFCECAEIEDIREDQQRRTPDSVNKPTRKARRPEHFCARRFPPEGVIGREQYALSHGLKVRELAAIENARPISIQRCRQ